VRAFLLASLLFAACGDDDAGAADGGADDLGAPRDARPRDPDANHIGTALDPAVYAYEWTCSGEVPGSGAPLDAEPPSEDCSAGVWPDLEPALVCPTVTEVTREDPASGQSLPLDDARSLPLTLPVSESGSFLPADLPTTWPATLKVVSWNMEYTRNLDAQIETLTTHPDLVDADVWLLSEVDRCSTRNDVRRAARLLAQAVQGAYVYGIEFVELSIGREVGGDTGQAIVSRRPLSGAGLLCHSAHYDWFGSDDEPRLGSRVVLGADVPVGDTSTRVWAVHFESNDFLGEFRAVQAKELLDAAQATACDRPQVIAGDFNAWYVQAPELDVVRRSGFTDAMMTLGDAEATHDNGFRLDYVFARGLEVVDGAVLREVDTSDHYPVWVEMRVE